MCHDAAIPEVAMCTQGAVAIAMLGVVVTRLRLLLGHCHSKTPEQPQRRKVQVQYDKSIGDSRNCGEKGKGLLLTDATIRGREAVKSSLVIYSSSTEALGIIAPCGHGHSLLSNLYKHMNIPRVLLLYRLAKCKTQ